MSGIAITPGASQADVDALAVKTPSPATVAPLAEKVGAAVGQQPTRYALEDHRHPRLTSTTYATLGSDGTATIAFSRSFVNKPGLNITETDATASAQVLVCRGLAWVRDGNGLYTGVTIQGRRSQMLPTINPLSGALTLLTQVVTGVNALISTLTNYDVFSGPAAGLACR